jgi:misacylated tRNA(Ala) deacylase
MRIRTAQHILNGVIWQDHGALVTGADMRAGSTSSCRRCRDRIPRSVDLLRVIDIVGLDRQADGCTHVASTGEVGHVRVVKTESKGRSNKRIRIAVAGGDAP